MFPSGPTTTNNKTALRQALHSSLQEALMDVASDVQQMGPGASGGSSGLGQGLFDQSFVPPSAGFGSSGGVPPIPPFLQNSVMGANGQPESSVPSLPLQQPDASLLSHARAALLKQQLIADERKRQLLLEEKKKMLLQDSYMAMLRGSVSTKAKAAATSSSQPMALNSLLAAQASLPSQQLPTPQLPSANPAPPVPQAPLLGHPAAISQQKQTPNALEALGSSLRNKNDPYIDVSSLQDPDPKDTTVRRTRGGVSTPFPEKLHEMLLDVEKDGKTDIVSFFSHGRAFGVHDIDRFVAEVMPKYFKQSKWNSFARQLNLYGFIRITSGPDAGGWYNELFLRGRPNLCFHMRRVGVPQGGDRRKLKVKQEAPDPDFYSMKPLAPAP